MNSTQSKDVVRARIARLSGRIAANARIAAPGYDGREATRAATAARWAKLEAECDPEGLLPADERRAKAKKLFCVQMDEGKLRKARKQLRKAKRQ